MALVYLVMHFSIEFIEILNVIVSISKVAVISVPTVMPQVNSVSSTSLADKAKIPELSSLKLTSEIFTSIGASFIGEIVNITSALEDSIPSETVNIKLSGPL